MLNHTHLLGHCLGSQWWELAIKATSVKGFKRLRHPRVMPSSLNTKDLLTIFAMLNCNGNDWQFDDREYSGERREELGTKQRYG